jgi:hypothetical protein
MEDVAVKEEAPANNDILTAKPPRSIHRFIQPTPDCIVWIRQQALGQRLVGGHGIGFVAKAVTPNAETLVRMVPALRH